MSVINRVRKIGVLAVTAAMLATLAATSPPGAAASEDEFLTTVQNVSAQVSRTGGITVRGEVSCKAAVELWELENGPLPADAVVHLGLEWTAYQPAGRKAMITASWGSDHLSPCYSVNDPDAFWPWSTTYAGSTADVYVHSTDGRFVKGWVHIDVKMYGGFSMESGESEYNVIIIPEPPGEQTWAAISVAVFTAPQFDVRATR